MNWQINLSVALQLLGDNPSQEQLGNLETWIIHNVPRDAWGGIAWALPSDLVTDFRMRYAENGGY
jgi:hypothetical protein